MTIARTINALLFERSPYDDIDHRSYPFDLQGWCQDPEIFDTLIDQIRPELIIEVGSWKGASAHRMIKRALQYKNAAIICVDTWLGSSEHWLDPEWRRLLKFRGGRPTLHEQFMANVVHAGLQDHIVPLPLPSRTASEVLAGIRFSNGEPLNAPLIYIDAAHDEASVREDIASFWPLVGPGGVMFGDDHVEPWTGVIKAVAGFHTEYADQIAASGTIKTRWYAQKKRP